MEKEGDDEDEEADGEDAKQKEAEHRRRQRMPPTSGRGQVWAGLNGAVQYGQLSLGLAAAWI